MDFLSDINIAGKISIASVASESASMDALFRNSSSEITKRTLGTMALQATANYYNSVDSDARFLQSVSINLPTIFNVTTSNATPSSTGLVAVLSSQPQNTVFAAPTSFNGTPSFRSLVIADTTGLQTALDAKLSGSGSAGYLSKYTGSLTLGNSVIYESGGNVNIGGSTTPTARLSFQNNIAGTGGATVAINLREGLTSGGFPAYGIGFSNGASSAFTEYRTGTVNDNVRGHRFLVNNNALFTMQGDGAFVMQGISGSSVARLKFIPMGVSTEKVLIDLNVGSNTSDGLPAYGIGFGPTTEGYVSYRSGQANTSIYGHKFFINSVESFRLRGDLTATFNGSVGIGSSTLSNYNFRIQKNISGSATSYGFSNSGTIQSDVTAGAFYNQTVLNTQAASFTLPFVYHNSAQQGTIGSGSSVLTQVGYFAQASLTGATTNIGFRGAIAAGTNRWNTYMDGTASNYFAGNVYIGSTSGTYKLDVTGDINTSTFYRIGGVRVGEWGQFQTHEQYSTITSVNYGASFLYGASGMPGTSPQWHILKLGIGSEYSGQATYMAFGRPFGGYFDGKIYVRGLYGSTDSGWLSMGGNGVQDYSYERGETLVQYKGTLIEETTGDKGVFLGKDIVNGGIIFEMQVVDIDSSDVITYQNWINPADGRLYYINPVSPYEKIKYLIEGEGGGSSGSYSGTFPISVSGSVISIATASGSQAGAISSTDWNTFNNKFNLPGGGSDGQVLTKSGGGAVWASVGSGGVYSGSAPIQISGTTISILTASSSQTGALSSTDWTTFNNKFSVPSGGTDGQVLVKSGSSVVWGTVSTGGTSYTGVSPISVSGSNISIQQANTSQSGFLSSTDWNTFNNKLSDGFTSIVRDTFYEGANINETLNVDRIHPNRRTAGIWFNEMVAGVRDTRATLALDAPNYTQATKLQLTGFNIDLKMLTIGSGKIEIAGGDGLWLQQIEFDLRNIAVGKVLKATSANKVEFVNP